MVYLQPISVGIKRFKLQPSQRCISNS